jgi:hypothetical protein
MNDDKDLQQLLKSAFEPVTDTKTDRWAAMSRRLERRPLSPPWFEWALGVAALVLLAVSSRAFPILLNWL